MPATPRTDPRVGPPSSPPPAIRLSGLSKRFGARWALREVDLRVERGAVLALVGPNGAGKTTLLRILATIQKPSAGEVEVLGHPARTQGDAIRRRVSLLTPSGYLYDELTGAENLRFADLMSGRKPDRERILRALDGVGLGDAAELRVRAYSDGMRKRLEVARLMLRRTDLLLMDEPYASLDAEGARIVDDVLSRARAEGRTVLFATHRRGRALAACDRVVALAAGRVAADGPPGAVEAELGRPGLDGPGAGA